MFEILQTFFLRNWKLKYSTYTTAFFLVLLYAAINSLILNRPHDKITYELIAIVLSLFGAVFAASASNKEIARRIAKRIVDLSLGILLPVIFTPLFLLVTVLIRVTSPGPVFYRQVRCGLHGRKFRLIRFRTMIEGAEDKLWEIKHLNEMKGPVFKMRNDPRVTPLGRVLRKFSVDELPQVWNVLKGEMSIVGPRAPLPEEVQHYTTKQRRRLSVKPGIICLWQVSGRTDIDFNKWMELDLDYIDNWSLRLDFKILSKVVVTKLQGKWIDSHVESLPR